MEVCVLIPTLVVKLAVVAMAVVLFQMQFAAVT